MSYSIKVSNLPAFVTEDALWRLFSRCGTVENVRLFANFTVERFAVVVFSEMSAVKKARLLDGVKLADSIIKVD